MYIAIYVSSIVLFCAGAIAVFVFCDKKNKRIAKKLKQQSDERNLETVQDLSEMSEEGKTMQNDSLISLQGELEDFSLDPETKEQKPKRQSFDLDPFNLNNHFTTNNYVEEDAFDRYDFGKNDNEEDANLDRKFKEYEDFLRRNLDIDDEDFEEDEMPEPVMLGDFPQKKNEKNWSRIPQKDYDVENDLDDLSMLQDFDFDSLKGKSEEEIEATIKNLPPKIQEILLNDILERRKFDDEE